MVGFKLRRVGAPLVLFAVALAGCATTPSEVPQTAPVPVAVPAEAPAVAAAPAPTAARKPTRRASSAPAKPQTAAAIAAPEAAPDTLTQVDTTHEALEPLVEEIAAEENTSTVAGLTPEKYPDVFDRIRAGFKIEDINSRQIDTQLAFFANNPAYLERVFGRASLYMHHIVQEIERRGMPMELALLPVVESAFEPYARSWATAHGLWQFMPGTGERFGLKQDWWYDGRRDVLASTRAALDYLQYMHDEFFDDWLLAIAAYNCGEFRVQREVKANRAAGKPVDFFSLKLPAETRAYVPKLLAMRRLVANPEDFGLAFSPIPNEPYFAKVDTGGQLDLSLAAELAGITLEELFELNPGFHRWATDPAGPHFLLLPRDTADAFKRNLDLLSPDERVRVSLHTVTAGESVASIAQKYKTQARVVRDMNELTDNAPLVVGTELRVPTAVVNLPAKVMLAAARVDGRDTRTGRRPAVHVVRSGDSLWRIARRHRMDVNTLARMNGMNTSDTLRTGQKLVLNKSAAAPVANRAPAPAGSRAVSYSVRSGDTLSQIARLFGVTVSDLVSWNGISTRSVIRPGQKLTVNVRRH